MIYGENMGHVWAKVRIGNPSRTKFVEVNALVDIATTLTVVP